MVVKMVVCWVEKLVALLELSMAVMTVARLDAKMVAMMVVKLDSRLVVLMEHCLVCWRVADSVWQMVVLLAFSRVYWMVDGRVV